MPTYNSGTPLPPRPENVPAGKYRLRVLTAEETVTNSTRSDSKIPNGTEMIKLKCEVLASVDGRLNFDPESNPGPLVWDNLIFYSTTGWRVDQYRAARGEPVMEGVPVEVKGEEFIDDEFEAILSLSPVRDRQGKPTGAYRNEIKGFIAAKEITKAERPAADDIPF